MSKTGPVEDSMRTEAELYNARRGRNDPELLGATLWRVIFRLAREIDDLKSDVPSE